MDQHHTSRDVQLAELRARFLGWRIGDVPSALTRTSTWHAQPARYPIHAGGPDELANAISGPGRAAIESAVPKVIAGAAEDI